MDCMLQELPNWFSEQQQQKLKEVSDKLLGIGKDLVGAEVEGSKATVDKETVLG